MKSEQVRLGRNLKRIRMQKGISQGNIARTLKVGRSFITNIENGKTNPTLATLSKIAKVLGVAIKNLVE